jgi:nucleotide-binding universal stress UspA family protein
VPIDGSPTSRKALDEAIRIARECGAGIRLLHVTDELAWVTGFETAQAYYAEIMPLMRAAGERLLETDRKHAAEAGVPCDTVLVETGAGRICDHVAGQSRMAGADLIVLGSHGRRGVDRVLMGSDAEQIVRHAPVPVLVVRG